MTKRYRLKARAQIHGEVRDPGYIFTLAEGEVGPHRTIVGSQHGAQIVDHIGSTGQDLVDEPLFEEVEEKAEEDAPADSTGKSDET